MQVETVTHGRDEVTAMRAGGRDKQTVETAGTVGMAGTAGTAGTVGTAVTKRQRDGGNKYVLVCKGRGDSVETVVTERLFVVERDAVTLGDCRDTNCLERAVTR